MESLTIGNLVVATDDGGICFSDATEGSIKLQPRAVAALFDFLRSSSVNPANRRRGFRIPIESGDGLESYVACDKGSFAAQVMDISLSGIRLEAIDSDAPQLEPGDEIKVTLAFGESATDLRGEVKRRAGEGYGIVFADAALAPQCDTDGPMADFARIIALLERRWLTQHVMPDAEPTEEWNAA